MKPARHLVALVTLVLLGAACRSPPPPPRRSPRWRPRRTDRSAVAMRAHFIDVGQGDAILLEFPCAAMLVDTGGEVTAGFDSNRALKSYLDRFFRRRHDLGRTLKLLAITHPHYDHTRGILGVLLARENRFSIENVITNGQEDEEQTGGYHQRMLHKWAAGQKDVRLRRIKLSDIPERYGLTGPIIDPIRCQKVDPRIRALYSSPARKPKDWDYRHWQNANNHSLVLRVDFGRASFLLMGSLEEEGIRELTHHMASTQLLKVDVLKVSQHGSERGLATGLLDLVSPQIAVIQMGSWKRWQGPAFRYGNPHLSVIEGLLKRVAKERKPAIFAPVATRPRTFKKVSIRRAIYATGWDGDVVIEARTDGAVRRLR